MPYVLIGRALERTGRVSGGRVVVASSALGNSRWVQRHHARRGRRRSRRPQPWGRAAAVVRARSSIRGRSRSGGRRRRDRRSQVTCLVSGVSTWRRFACAPHRRRVLRLGLGLHGHCGRGRLSGRNRSPPGRGCGASSRGSRSRSRRAGSNLRRECTGCLFPPLIPEARRTTPQIVPRCKAHDVGSGRPSSTHPRAIQIRVPQQRNSSGPDRAYV